MRHGVVSECPNKCTTCTYNPTTTVAECSACVAGSTVNSVDKTCGGESVTLRSIIVSL